MNNRSIVIGIVWAIVVAIAFYAVVFTGVFISVVYHLGYILLPWIEPILIYHLSW